MTALAPPAHGVLSQNFRQDLDHLAAADPPAFNQAERHPHMGHDDGGELVRDCNFGRGAFLVSAGRLSALVEIAFLQLAFTLTVVSDTSSGGLLPAVRLPAAKGTAQVVPASIPEVGEEVDAAVPATGQAPAQMRLGSKDRAQHGVILQHQPTRLRLTIPVGLELKPLCNPYYKKPNLCPRMLMKCPMPSSYLIAVPLSSAPRYR
jgi:hypothetical protein